MYPTRTTFATGTFAVPPRVSRPGRWQEVGTLPPSPAPRPGRWVDAAAAAVPVPAPAPVAVPAAADARPAVPVSGPAPEPDSAALSPAACSAAPEPRCEPPAPWAEPRGGHPAPEPAPGHWAEPAARDARFEVPPPAVAPDPWTDAAVPLPAAEAGGAHAAPVSAAGALGEIPAPAAAAPDPWADAAVPLSAAGALGEIPAPAVAPESGPAPLPAVGGEHPDPVETTEPGPGSWTSAGQAPASHPGHWAEAGTMRPHPAQPAEVRGEVPAPTAAPGSGPGSWTEAAAPRPARLAAVGGPEAEHGSAGWGTAGDVRGGHPVAEADPGHARRAPAAEADSDRRPDARAEADVPEVRGEHQAGAETVGVRPAAEAQASRPAQPTAVGGPEAEHGHGRWAEEAPQASLPGQLAPVGGPEPLDEAGPGHGPEPAVPAPAVEATVPDARAGVPASAAEVRAGTGSGRWAEAAVPGGRADVPVSGVEVGLSEVRVEDGFSGRAEGGLPDGRFGVPAPGVEIGVSDVRAEAAVPGVRAGVPAPGVEVRAEVGVSDRSASGVEAGVSDGSAAGVEVEVLEGPATGAEVAGMSEGSGAGAAVGVPHTRDGDEARPGRGEVPAARADAPGPGVVDVVARAVARGIRDPEAADGRAGSRLRAGRGAGVAEVPVRLPFRAQPQPRPPVPPRPAAPARPRADAGRRVPRGDDRLREHRGPVLPGWVAVFVGALALTGCAAVLWRAGVVPAVVVAAFGATPRAYQGLRVTHWPPLAFLGVVALVALGGLGRARAGHAWVLTLFGRYRGTVRRTGLTWVSPLLLRRRVDVRLRHWRSDPMPAVDAGGLALRAVVQVVWQVKDTARATLAVEDHTEYLAEQVESAMARVLSRLPADAFHEDAPSLRDAEAVGDALTRLLAAETEAVGIEVYSAQPTRIEYAPEVAEAMRRRRVAAIDAKHRDAVLTSVVDAVDDTVHRLTSRGLVELDDYERKALVKDLTVAFYTGRPE
ncbi:SPFH domain / Band 7 family protein [Streptomyces sp. ADI91-18]|uniref:SPFH domain-containing protein n=1 Tax=Streptomyces sp. ADI91-18 TaxID=1522755 RepID=UPI000FA90D9A|nr:SPFH domain-containing protein [Streptomyces sp. ADI91-18]RPK51553.1 SPFH domain / Band 7 family protein [Streptomyces sp. ADI91-18]